MKYLIFLENETDFAPEFSMEEITLSVMEHVLTSEHCPFSCEVNLTVTDEDGIHTVNKEYRGVDAPTDVLSFPTADYAFPADFTALIKNGEYTANRNPDTDNYMLGDIMICKERVLSQAEEYEHSVKREFAFLVCHSLLHLIGYDHMKEEDARIMEAKQARYLEDLGITRD